MKKVCTEHLLPGMEMARDVHGADGSVFIPKGTILTDDDIQSLGDLGLSSVSIKSQGKEEDLADLARRCEEYVRPFFSYVNPQSVLFNAIYARCLQQTMSRLTLESSWHLPCLQELQASVHQSRRDLFFHGEGGPEDIVSHEMELISVPDTYFKLQEILKSPESSASHVAEVIKLDINLVAKLLQLVNSPIYAFPSRIDSVERAVAIIGVEGVSSLALGITAMPMFKDIPPDLMDVSTFWNHSISCAIFSKELAQACGLEAEKFFTIGLLHDVGRLILLKNLPLAYLQVLLMARGGGMPLLESEEAVLGYNHARVGEVMLKEWRCPEIMTLLVGAHHSAQDCPLPREASIIQLADNLTHAWAIAGGWTYVLPGMAEESWQNLGLKTEDVIDIMNGHEQSLREISRVLVQG